MKQTLLLLLLLAGLSDVSGQIGFYENNITGVQYSTLQTQNVIAADLDGDNDLDVVAHGSGINWYENVDGQGNFGQKNPIDAASLGMPGATLEAADFDGDGHLDLMASATNKLTLYRNSGNGAFSVLQVFSLGQTSTPISAEAVDMNQDGFTDIVAYYNNGGGAFQGWISWFQNDGNGVFGAAQILNNTSSHLIYGTQLHAADLDNDNDTDLILGYGAYNRIAWFENTGNNVFAAPVTISTSAELICSISTVDFDLDGDTDIIAGQRNGNQVVWYENLDGAGTFADEFIITSGATMTYSALAADLNNDNLIDILYSGTNEIGWHSRLAAGNNFGPAQVITNKAYNVRKLVLADLDGDGKKDLISASYDDDKVAWYRNLDNNGNFGRQVVIARAVENPSNSYPGDFDGDGDIDIMINSQFDAKVTWFENVNGIGFFGKEHIVTESVAVGNFTPIIYPADFDGDGDLDLATRQGNDLFLYTNDGTGSFTAQPAFDTDSPWTILRSKDLDGDGDMDLLAGQYSNDKLSWYRNLGGGTFSSEQIIFNPGGNNGSLTSMQIADMDGDGDMDFIVSSYNSYTEYYVNADGQGQFVHQNVLEFERLMSVYPVDLDGDGDLDVVGVDSNGGGAFNGVVWYRNTGQGTFDDSEDISTLQIHGHDITAADLDNDGDMDVITGAGHSQTSGQLAWYPNNGNGTFQPRQMIHELFNATHCKSVSVADIDSDGAPDLIAVFTYSGNNTLGKASVFKNLGSVGNTVSGTILVDTDANGCTPSDLKGSNMLVIASTAGHSFGTFTDENGAFQMATNTGAFTTSVTSQLPEYFSSNPESHAFTFTGMNNAYAANFCLTPVGTVNDLDVAIYPLTEVRPGFNARYRIVFRNKGTTAQSGVISLEYNHQKLNFITASAPVSSAQTGLLSFDYTNLALFETRSIDVTFDAFAPPVTNINEELDIAATIEPVADDATPGDNDITLYQTVIGSYDPNDIRCLEGDEVAIEDADDYLHYIIRFQNTGTASAINVRVESLLDAKLDWTTMQLESMSHNGRIDILDGNNVRFTFDNIYLAASTIDEPNSHGFITYKIKPVADVAVNDIASATANIYFDFNPPITTNTATTQFTGTLSVADHRAGQFTLYPNPTRDVVRIASELSIDKVTVTDLHGRILQELTVGDTEALVSLEHLSPGMYVVTVTSGGVARSKKVVRG